MNPSVSFITECSPLPGNGNTGPESLNVKREGNPLNVKERMESYGPESLSLEELAQFITGRDKGRRTKLQRARLKAAKEYGRRIAMSDTPMRVIVKCPEDLRETLIPRLNGIEREEFHAVLLNARNAVIRVVRIARGTVDACSLHPRDVFKEAIESDATGIILSHNHPSGNPSPSQEDISLTNRLKEGARALGIRLVDHLIVAGNTITSLRAMGAM